jgi:hypothetical protein
MRPDKYKHNYPSVTEILDLLDKPGLCYAYGYLGIQEMEKRKNSSQKIGHAVHGALEKYLRKQSYPEVTKDLSQHEIEMLMEFVNWCKKKKIKPHKKDLEREVYSHKYQYGGTLDCKFKNKIIDWKTDRPPKTEKEKSLVRVKYGLQNAGYALAVEEEDGVKINQAYTIRVSKQKEFAEYYFKSLTKYKKFFIYLRELYKEIYNK